MKTRTAQRAFSLVEVVIAVAIFGFALTAMLALLPALTRQAAESAETLAAQRLPDAVRVELRAVAERNGFGALATMLPALSAPLKNGATFAAPRDGSWVKRVETSVAIDVVEAYYAIEIWRFAEATAGLESATAPLAAYVRVSWPWRAPGALVDTPLEQRHQFTFVVAIDR